MAVTMFEMPQSTLVRSSAKTAAIRRGEIKISSPIALLSEHHATIADAVPIAGTSEVTYVEPTRSVDVQLVGEAHHIPTTPARLSRETTRTSHRHNHALLRKGSQAARTASTQRSTQSQSQRNSLLVDMSQFGDRPPSPIKRRKSNGLKNVLRKMFGRKDKAKEDYTTIPLPKMDPTKSSSVRHNYHRSDPGFPIPPLAPKEADDLREGRVVSLPLGVDGLRQNPLGSHLPFPMNVNAPQPDSAQRDYMKSQLQPRRATLPSLVFSHPDAEALLEQLRSVDDRKIEPETQSLRESTIGIALTTKEDVCYNRRRSRSVDELRKLLKEHGRAQPRRRSDELNEIRSWRLSYLDRPDSVLVTAHGIPDQDHDHYSPQTHHVENEMDEPDGATIAPDASELDERQMITHDLVRLVKQTRGPDSGIAASTDGLERQTPDRMSHVESRLRTLEDSVQKMNGRSNRHTIILEGSNRPRRAARRRAHSPVPGAMRSSSPDSSGDEEPLFTPGTVLFSTPNHGPVKSGSFSDDSASLPPASIYPHLTPLYNALQYERSARKRLESELLKLQREIYDLQVVVRRLEDNKNGYPTPSPDTTFHAYLDREEDGAQTDKEVFETPQEEISTPRLVALAVDDGEIF